MGNTDDYQSSCTAMSEQFVDSKNLFDTHWTAWTCALGPNALVDMSVPLQLAQKLVVENSQEPQYRVTLGAVLYRAGEFEEAGQTLEESIELFASDESDRSSINYARLFLAMSQWQLGKHAEARQQFEELQQSIDQELASPTAAWNRKATLELFSNEAQALIFNDEDDDTQQDDAVKEIEFSPPVH